MRPNVRSTKCNLLVDEFELFEQKPNNVLISDGREQNIIITQSEVVSAITDETAFDASKQTFPNYETHNYYEK